MNFFKKNWKNILLILFLLLFITKCNSSGNYKRKLNIQEQRNEYIKDSLNTVYSNSAKYIDSLNYVIKSNNQEIKSLNEKIQLLEKQNTELSKKPVIVKIDNNKHE